MQEKALWGVMKSLHFLFFKYYFQILHFLIYFANK